MMSSGLNFSRKSRIRHGLTPVSGVAGGMVLELGFWILGIMLVLAYLAVSASLENQRKQGIELFSEARAAAMTGYQSEDRVHDGSSPSLRGEQVAESSPAPADAAALPIAVLRVARVGVEVPIYPDLSELNLNRGGGWIEGTAAPNTGGNMAVAAHRDRYFRPLKDIQLGDILELESLSGHGEFRVSRIVIVDPDDVSVLDDTTVPTLTLVTCYPFYFIGNAPQRYIVQAIAVDQSGKESALDAPPTALPSGETP